MSHDFQASQVICGHNAVDLSTSFDLLELSLSVSTMLLHVEKGSQLKPHAQ